MAHPSRWLIFGLVLMPAGCGSAPAPPRAPSAPPPPRLGSASPEAAATRPNPRPQLPGAPPSIEASIHLALGVPRGADDSHDILMDKGVYVVSYSPTRKVANWVAWRLDENDLGDADRANDFRADDTLAAAAYHVTPNDYAHSGFDRGHLCPSADRTRSAEANSLTFLMTNMHPQRPELNRVTWKALEEYERGLAREHHEVYVIAGGLFNASPATIGHGVAVPRADYKVVVVLGAGQGVESVTEGTEVIAVVMPNEPAVKEKPWKAYLTTVDELERESGYDFLTRVPASVQNLIEARVAIVP